MEGSLFATIKTQYEKLEAENKQLKLQLEAEQNSQERTRKDHVKQINQHLEEIMDLKNELKVTREVEINGSCGYKTQIDDLKKEIKHKDNKFAEWCEENKQLKDQLDKCEAERMYLHKVYHETKKQFYIPKKEPETGEDIPWTLADENKQLKGYINSLMTEDQKDICDGEAMEAGEQTLQTPKDWIDRIRMFLEERDKLEQAVEDLEEEECRLELENKQLKETNQIRFDKIKEMENEVGVAKLVHHQNMGLLEDIKKLKDCNYEEYCELVSENKLIKEFEDLKNELGELN